MKSQWAHWSQIQTNWMLTCIPEWTSRFHCSASIYLTLFGFDIPPHPPPPQHFVHIVMVNAHIGTFGLIFFHLMAVLLVIPEEVSLCHSDPLATVGLRPLRICKRRPVIFIKPRSAIWMWMSTTWSPPSPQESLMNRVKKQLHEWDENLKDDSLPTNAIGQAPPPNPNSFPALFIAPQCTRAHSIGLFVCVILPSSLSPPPFPPSCLVPIRLLLQSGGLSAHRRLAPAAAAENRQCHSEASLRVGHNGSGEKKKKKITSPHILTHYFWFATSW